jgi:hypothetical protein
MQWAGRVATASWAYLIGALLGGALADWATAYILAPAEPKWSDAPFAAFEIGLLYVVGVAAIATLVYGVTVAGLGCASRLTTPRWQWHFIAGCAFLFFLLMLLDVAGRLNLGGFLSRVASEGAWVAVAGGPICLAVLSTTRGSRAALPSVASR